MSRCVQMRSVTPAARFSLAYWHSRSMRFSGSSWSVSKWSHPDAAQGFKSVGIRQGRLIAVPTEHAGEQRDERAREQNTPENESRKPCVCRVRRAATHTNIQR
jgi:hypothetical protein